MKIAIVTDDGKTISRHFGRATHYLVVTAEDGKIIERELREKLGHQHFSSEEHGTICCTTTAIDTSSIATSWRER